MPPRRMLKKGGSGKRRKPRPLTLPRAARLARRAKKVRIAKRVRRAFKEGVQAVRRAFAGRPIIGMKKIVSAVLAFVLLASAALFAAGCSSEPYNAVSVAQLCSLPAVFVDTSEYGYAPEEIGTDTLVYTYQTAQNVTVGIENGEEHVTLSEPSVTDNGNGTSTATHTVQALSVGEYRLRFFANGEEDGYVDLAVLSAYPEDPHFTPLEEGGNRYYGGGNTNEGTNDANVHDPVVLEVNGKFYCFSTDNAGDYGYQVRESDDLIHWEYVGTAIRNCGNAESAPGLYERGGGALREVYELLAESPDFDCYTLWAPEVVPAADGGYWLYGSWTTTFGSARSVIFQCHADSITGPYTFVDIVVYTTGNNANSRPNAIDASIYYDPEGNMYMSYGSFFGGIWCLELDPETGLRADGVTLEQMYYEQGTEETLYGTRLVNGSVEGSVVTYKENVPVYNGDLAEYDASGVSYKSGYWLMSSADGLSVDYNMRSLYSAQPTDFGGYDASVANRVGGSFSWKTSARDTSVSYNFTRPGHNDMLSARGVDLLAYHNRIYFNDARYHYLFLSMYAFDSQGRIVMSPNRYAGEAVRAVSAAELTQLSGGNYDFCLISEDNPADNYNGGYATEGLRLVAGGTGSAGTLTFGGKEVGEWYLYGENWVCVSADLLGTGSRTTYYGAAMPAWIDAEARGGITLSLLSEDGQTVLFCNQNFSAAA